MSYLLDKRRKNKKIIYFFLCIFILFLFYFFQNNIFAFLSRTGMTIYRPVSLLGNNIAQSTVNLKALFASKKDLIVKNKVLMEEIEESNARVANYDSVVEENERLKGIFDRRHSTNNFILAAILAKPNKSIYDTLVIDIGEENEVRVGSMVFALGDIPIGKVSEVSQNSSKVVLFSSWKEKTEVAISGSDNFMQIVGRGGGNFEMILPRDFNIKEGAQVLIPGINTYLLATVKTVLSDPRDSYKKALLVSPINVQELKFVQVMK